MVLGFTIFSDKKELENKDFQVVSYYSNGKSLENLDIYNQDINLYIGMTYKGSSDNFYSDEYIIGMLEKSLKLTSGKINLEVGGELSMLMNQEIVNNDLFMENSEQKEYLFNLLENNFSKEEISRVNIKFIEVEHEDLLLSLGKENGYKSDKNVAGLIKGKYLDEITSLDIYNLLYLESQKNDKLLKISANTQSSLLKEKRNERSSYYGLAEVAIRLKDLIEGKNIQGGESRQKRYDAIINKILNKEYNSDIMKILYSFLYSKTEKKNLESSDFFQVYIDKTELVSENDNSNSIDKLNKEIKLFIGKTALSISLVLGLPIAGYKYNDYKYTKEKKEKLDILKQRDIDKVPGYNADSIIENIIAKESFEKKIVEYFISKYGLGDFDNKEELENLLLDAIKSYQVEKELLMIYEYKKLPEYKSKEDNFLNDFNGIIKKIEFYLTSKGIFIDSKFGKFNEYKEIIEKTIEYDTSNIEVLGLQVVSGIEDFLSVKHGQLEIGILRCQNTGASPGTTYSKCKGIEGYEKLFVARKKGNNGKYSLELGQEVAKELIGNN